ncbi:MAG TPA: thioredoxin-like domain-containing protein [Pirellulales bacterium]|nr:thioredoxin-like domain-containing protein [Pirellulales bacterium]
MLISRDARAFRRPLATTVVLALALAIVGQRALAQRPGFAARRKAPSLEGGVGWINTDGPLEMSRFRGKFVLVDFWTYCCINCMHILPELKKLERAFPNNLVVIGVHSGKFESEKDSDNIREAVLRYKIEHPVINDANYAIWKRWGIDTWPSLRLIDPDGNLVFGVNGEVDAETLESEIKKLLPRYRRQSELNETPLEFNREQRQAKETPLSFPGKLLADAASDRLFIADSNHHRIVICDLAGKLLGVVGSGALGRDDGGYEQATFNQPQGLALKDQTLYVADTENHSLRKIDLAAGRVTTIAGTGQQRREMHPTARRSLGNPLRTALSSPWDLCIHGDDLYIAMAGTHQIWRMSLDEKQIGVHAGNGAEDIVDGVLPKTSYAGGSVSFAQPSGLATDGQRLYVADSEGSSIRSVPFAAGQSVTTVVGTANLRASRLFTFGDVDGPAARARFQHPIGLAYDKNRLYVADTYNNKLRAIDLGQSVVTTVAGSRKPGNEDEPPAFDEPAGVSVAGNKLYVADTNNHAIRTIDLNAGGRVATLAIAGLKPPRLAPAPTKPALPDPRYVRVSASEVKPVDGELRLEVSLALPAGYRMNDMAPTQYWVETDEETGLVEPSAFDRPVKVAPPASDFRISLPLAENQGAETLKICFVYYYCEAGDSGVCKVGSVVWIAPIRVAADAAEDAVALKHRAN